MQHGMEYSSTTSLMVQSTVYGILIIWTLVMMYHRGPGIQKTQLGTIMITLLPLMYALCCAYGITHWSPKLVDKIFGLIGLVGSTIVFVSWAMHLRYER